MNTPARRSSFSESESGQAAAFMALLLFVVFLAFAALAIDGAMTYSVRRDLQNVADSATLAACRGIATNDTTTTPMAAAKNAIGVYVGRFLRFNSWDVVTPS